MTRTKIQTIAASRTRRAQGGFTIIELMIVLMIAAIIIAGAFIGLHMRDNANSQNQAQLLAQGAQCTRSIYSNAADFTGVTGNTLAANHCFPANNISGSAGSYVVKDNNGYVVSAAPNTLQTTNDSVAFTVSGVPDSECTLALSDLAPSASQLTAGPVGSGSANVVMAYGGKFNPATAGAACANGTDDIVYVFTK